MANDRSSRLANAMRERQFLRFSRRFEDFVVHGYVLDIGPRFFLLALVSDRLWFDGFECFRIADVRDIRPDPYAAFAEAALKKRGERVSRKPRVSLASVEELLLSANRAFPLVTIHREQADPDVCNIGRVVAIDRGACRYWRSIPTRPGTRCPSSITCARSRVSAWRRLRKRPAPCRGQSSRSVGCPAIDAQRISCAAESQDRVAQDSRPLAG